MTKSAPIRATGPHIGIVGHTTIDELRRNLTDIEMSNGFGNRFVFLVVRRSKEVWNPEDHEPDAAALAALADRLKCALQHGRSVARITMTDAALVAWRAVYSTLSADRLGVVGALLGRAEAQVQRLAALYCLLDQQQHIDLVHLQAALALWQYAEGSTTMLFGDSTGDPDADILLAAVRQRHPARMTDSDISALFGHNRSKVRLDQIKALLVSMHLIDSQTEKTDGRPLRSWGLKRKSTP